MSEANFPRGGAKPRQEKEAKTERTPAERNLFQEKNEEKKKKNQKRKQKITVHKSTKKAKLQEKKGEQDECYDRLTSKVLSVGMVVLGCVKEVHEYEVIMALPNNLSGSIAITNISDAYRAQLQTLTQGGDADVSSEEVADLNELFKPGIFLPCKVMSVKKGGGARLNIQLSVNPKDVHQQLTAASIRSGMALYGNVASREDHGYIIDLGVKNIKAFLKNKDAERYIQLHNEGYPLSVGRPVLCQVATDVDRMERLAGETRAINVTIDPKKVIEAQTKETKNLNWLVAGMKVPAKVKKVSEADLTVELASCQAYINRSHLQHSPSNYNNGQKIVATILYVHPTSKLIILSCLDHIVNYDGVPNTDRFGNLEIGTVVEEATILRIEKNGIYLKLGDKLRGFASSKNLSNGPAENRDRVFKKGSNHRCRVLGFDLVDDRVIVTLKKEIIDQQFISIKDIEPGSLVECTVENMGDKGVTVNVTSKIHGLIPTLHLADVPLKHPEKKFEKGKKLKCRVLTVDKVKQKVKLTHKKSLVNSKYPPLTSFSQLETGLEAEGFIADVKDKGCLVVFYNDMKGWVPLNELSTEYIPLPQKIFYKGQVVRCRVKSWSEEEKKVTLTFKLEGKPHFGTKLASAPDNFEIGKLTDCKVKKKSEKGLDVELLPSRVPAFIPTMHLSDSNTTQHLLLDVYKPGDLITDAVCLSRTNVIMLSLRHSMVKASKEGHIKYEISQLQEGLIIPASVKRLMDYGIFVKLPGDLDGLIPNKLAVDRKVDDLSTVYCPGQPVLVKVTNIDHAKGRFLGSLLMADCYHGDTNIGLDILENYWNDSDNICQHLSKVKGEDNSGFLSISVGDICKVVIDEVTEVGVLGHDLKTKVRGFATEDHMKGVSVTAGEQIEAVVIFTDVMNKSVEFSLDRELVYSIKNLKITPASQPRQKQHIKADVVLVKPDFILVALRGHAIGQLAYLPAKRHHNDVLEFHQFVVGQSHQVVIKRVGKRILCSLVVHEERIKSQKKMAPKPTQDMMSDDEKADGKFTPGDILEARIRKIHPLQMDISVGDTKGRVHVTETVDTIKNGTFPFSEYKISQKIDVRLLGFRDEANKFVTFSRKSRGKSLLECTMKPSKWSLEKKKLADGTKNKYKVEGTVVAYVQNHSNHCIWFNIDPLTRGRAYKLNLSDSLEEVAHPENHFNVGCGYNARILSIDNDDVLELSLLDQVEPVKEGKCAIAWIANIVESVGLIVKLAAGYKGSIKLTDIADVYTENLLADFEKGQYLQCFVKSSKHKEECHLSLRSSRLRNDASNVKDPEVTMETLSKGQVLRGFVIKYHDKKLLVSLACDLCGYVFHNHLSDFVIEDPSSVFVPGHLVTVKVLSIDTNSKLIDLSMRESETGVEERIPETLKSTRAPSPSSKAKYVKKRRTSDSENSDKKRDKASKRKRRKRSESESSDNKGESASVLRGKKRTKSEGKDKNGDHASKAKRKKNHSESEHSDSDRKNVKEDKNISESDSDSGIDGINGEDKAKVLPRLAVMSEFSWDSEFTAPTEEGKLESDEESESFSETITKKKKTKAQIRMEKMEEEKRLYEYERQQLEGEITPQVAEDFDKLVLQSPNSSMVWLRYMAYHLETAEVEKARAVAERALKTISFREEQEKFNVWVGYLNLENMYGTPELLKKVLDRALQQNEPLDVYQQMVNIYVKSGKMEEAEQLYNIMTKKLSQNKDVWRGFGDFYFRNQRAESARKLLQRSLKSLDQKFHVETISKFAQMEFKYGEPERGKTMFENILSNYPKRTDLWSVYIDMVTKLGELENTRQIFERVINLKLSAKKMKFFFKKYLDFEKVHGDSESMEDVKNKALTYVESKGYVED